MKKALWFASGFILAAAIGLALWRPVERMIAGEPTPPPTESATATGTATTPTETFDARPSPTRRTPSLGWQREVLAAGLCDRLAVDEDNRGFYGRCSEGLRLARLTPQELTTYLTYVARYEAFTHVAQTNPGRVDNSSVRLQFSGRGRRAPTDVEKVQVATWAALVYERLVGAEERAELVGLARQHLSGRLGISMAAIREISVEPVTWVDACLGIPAEGRSCPSMLTPGFRILLDAGGVTHEYHTDLLGLVRALEVPTTVPTQTMAPTPTPTSTPMPSPTPEPTPPPLVVTDWLGEYYGNSILGGAPSVVRNDRWLDFNWGYGTPDREIPSDGFSARWSRRAYFGESRYRFNVWADDGVRVWVAGVLILDQWDDGLTMETVEWYVMTGEHEIVVEYYEHGGLAEISVTWERIEAEPTPTHTSTPEYWINDWRGAYYDNTALSGHTIVVRNDKEIDFDWGTGRPASNLPKDGFSVRWTRWLDFEEGPYRFQARVDDGVRLWVDKALVIDAWRTGAVATFEGHIWLEAGGHDVRVEYFDDVRDAEIQVGWQKLETFAHWMGEYCRNRDLSGPPAFTRDDQVIAFDWGEGSPGPRMPSNNFSVRWTRTLTLEGGRYRFWAHADDGIRLYVNGQPLIDEWRDSPGRQYEREIDLVSGAHALVVEYYEHAGSARVGVSWGLLFSETPTPTPTSVPTRTGRPDDNIPREP